MKDLVFAMYSRICLFEHWIILNRLFDSCIWPSRWNMDNSSSFFTGMIETVKLWNLILVWILDYTCRRFTKIVDTCLNFGWLSCGGRFDFIRTLKIKSKFRFQRKRTDEHACYNSTSDYKLKCTQSFRCKCTYDFPASHQTCDHTCNRV